MAKYTAKKKARIANGEAPTAGHNSDKAEPVKVKFTKLADAAVQAEADGIIHAATLQMKLMEKHIRAFQADRTYIDNAEAIHAEARERVRQWWIAHPGHAVKADRTLPPMRKQRLSEWRVAVRMGEWACVDQVIEYFRDSKMTFDDVYTVARCLDENVKNKRAPNAPDKAVFVDAIRNRKAAKTGRDQKDAKGNIIKAPPKAKDPKNAVKDGIRLTNGWRLWFGEPAQKKVRAEAATILKEIDANFGKLVALVAAN